MEGLGKPQVCGEYSPNLQDECGVWCTFHQWRLLTSGHISLVETTHQLKLLTSGDY